MKLTPEEAWERLRTSAAAIDAAKTAGRSEQKELVHRLRGSVHLWEITVDLEAMRWSEHEEETKP